MLSVTGAMRGLVLVALLALVCGISAEVKEVRRIHEITEGPYKNYSAQPLITLGDGYYYFENNLQANWYGALEFCRNVGLHLVSVETEEENTLIVAHIATLGYQNYWLSGTDNNANGVHVWASTGKRVAFTDWHAGEPSFDRNEHCLDLWFSEGYLKWNDADCGASNYIICELMCDPCTPP